MAKLPSDWLNKVTKQVNKMAALNMRFILRRKILTLLLLRRRRQRLKYKKRFWIRKIYEERQSKGEFHTLVRELTLVDHEYFFRLFRMSPSTFEILLSWVAPLIKKKSTCMREPIPPDERLSVTLRYLVPGDAHTTIAASYRISPTSIERNIEKTCDVLWNTLSGHGFLRVPIDADDWKNIAKEFEQRWNFPHVVDKLMVVCMQIVTLDVQSRTSCSMFLNQIVYKTTQI